MWFTFSNRKMILEFQGAQNHPQCHRFPLQEMAGLIKRLSCPPWFWRWNPGYQNHPMGKESHLNQATIFRFQPLIFQGDTAIRVFLHHLFFFGRLAAPLWAPKDPWSMYQWGWFPRMCFCSRPVALGVLVNSRTLLRPQPWLCSAVTPFSRWRTAEFEFRSFKPNEDI